jgi:hypothetical protein
MFSATHQPQPFAGRHNFRRCDLTNNVFSDIAKAFLSDLVEASMAAKEQA